MLKTFELKYAMESCRPILGDGFQFYVTDGQCLFEVRNKEGNTENFKICYLIPKLEPNKLYPTLIPYYAIQIPNDITTHKRVWEIVQAAVIKFVWKLANKTYNEVDPNGGEFKSLDG